MAAPSRSLLPAGRVSCCPFQSESYLRWKLLGRLIHYHQVTLDSAAMAHEQTNYCPRKCPRGEESEDCVVSFGAVVECPWSTLQAFVIRVHYEW